MKEFFKYMLATVCGLMLMGVLLMVMSCVWMVSLLATQSSTTTTLTNHSVYKIELDGTMQERSTSDELTKMMQLLSGEESNTYGLDELLTSIRRAAEDEHIDGIYLKGGSLAMGIASATELRRELEAFKQTGKFVVAYAEQYGQLNYYVASVADRIYLNPQGMVSWHGLSMTTEFYTRLLEKLGVEMQVVKVGTFKSAVEPFMLTEMSEANRLQTSVFLEDIWQSLKSDVAASRDLTPEQLDALADRYMDLQPQEELVECRLVDSLAFVDQMEEVLSTLTGTEDYTLVTYSDMVALPEKPAASQHTIAVVYAEGDIVDVASNYSQEAMIVGKDYVETLDDLREDDDVEAVVLRVNSGGGSAYASEQICHALCRLKEKKPVVVSMGDYAASGGYYISSNANYIVAESTTLTGSIGIFGLIPSYGKLAQKIGIDMDGVKTNRLSDLETNAVTKGMNTEERALMQAEINRGYDLFTRRCAEGRGMEQEAIKKIGEGRVWTGQAALDLGLVDTLGGMEVALKKAAELAGLEDYQVAAYPEPEEWWESLLNEAAGISDDRVNARLEALIGKEAMRTYLYFSNQQTGKCTMHARLPYAMIIE